jgi:sortase A
MRRGPNLLIGLGAVLVLVSILAILLGRSPASVVAISRTAVASATAPPIETPAQRNAAAAVAAAAPSTAVTARISIPRIGIRNAPIYDRGLDAKGVMLIAPGYSVTHYAFSAPLGTGNTVLYGHDDIQGSIFGHLYDLGPGDLIQVSMAGQTQTYRVSGHQIVAPTSVGVLAPTADVRLTIITCWPFNVDTKRWIVTAFKS